MDENSPAYQEAISHGYSPAEIYDFLKQKGGEQTNAQDKQETYTEGNARRKAIDEVDASSQVRTQPSQEQSMRDGEIPQRDVNASQPSAQKHNEALLSAGSQGGGEIDVGKEDAKAEGQRTQNVQRKENGQGVRGQVPAGNEAKLNKRGNVPSVASQIIGGLTSPFGYIGEEGLKGIAGIARTFGANEFADQAASDAASSVEDWAKTFGGTPQKSGVGKTIGQVGAFALEAPLMFTGAGIPAFLAQGYGSMKQDLYDKYKGEGLDDEKANQKSSIHAGLNTVAAIPAYLLGGKVAGKVADKFIADSAPALLQLAGRFGMNGVMNMVASSVTRGFGAALEGEDPLKSAGDISFSGTLQDFAFAGHHTGEWFKNQLDTAQALRNMPEPLVRMAADTKEYGAKAKAELDRRDAEKQVQGAEQNNLPETAKVITETNVKPDEKIEETGGVSTEQGKPPVEAPAVKAEEGTPQPEGEGKEEVSSHITEDPKGRRVVAAAYHDPETGFVYEAADHQSAEEKAGKTPTERAEDRETENHGYTTENGEFITREKAEEIARDNMQFLGKKSDRPVMHSHEVELDHYPSDEAQIPEGAIPPKEEKGMPSTAEQARNIRDRQRKQGGFVDSGILKDIYSYGARVFEKGMQFGQWAKRMLTALGNGVKDVLGKIWNHFKDNWNKDIGGSLGSKADDFANNFKKNEEGKKKTSIKKELGEGNRPTPEEMPTLENKENVAQKVKDGTDPALKEVLDEMDKLPKTPEAQGWFHQQLQKMGLFKDDLKSLGLNPNEDPSKKTLFSGIGDAVQMVADIMDGTTIPKLTKAGVKLTATQHAQAKRMMNAYVDSLIARVFPDKYKNEESIEKVMDIINKDNILAGADAINANIDEIKQKISEIETKMELGIAGSRAKQELKDLKSDLSDQIDSLDLITKAHDLNQYLEDVEAAKGTDIEENINRWKEIVHPAMDELFKKVNGYQDLLDSIKETEDKLEEIDSDLTNMGKEGRDIILDELNTKKERLAKFEDNTERGRVFGARVNLLAKFKADELAENQEKENADVEPMISVDYRNPDIKSDKNARQALFNNQYSNDIRMILMNSFASRINEASKIDFYNDLVKNGVAKWENDRDTIKNIQGKRVVKMPVKWPTVNERTGKTSLQNRNLYVREDLYPEIDQVLKISKPLGGEGDGILNKVTQLQLIGFADGITHMKNVMTVVTNALGRDSLTKDLLSKIPFYNSAATAKEIYKIIKDVEEKNPEILAEIAEIASKSGMRPYFEQKGIQRYLSPMHKTLHDVDTAARIIMSRRWDNLVKRGLVDASEEGRIDFINQIGEYNSRLMGRWEAAMKNMGLSPFIVAGRAMNRAAKRLITGDPGFKAKNYKAELAARAINVSGLVMAATVPALINMMTTGSMFGRAGTPIGAIDFGPNADTKDGKRRTFDLFQLLSIRRGLRATGLGAAIDGLKNGDTKENIAKNALNDVFTTSMHPFLGPGLGGGIEVLTGKRLDMRSGYTDTYDARKIGGAMQYVENFRTAVKQQNELLYNLGVGKGIETAMGLVKTRDYPQGIPAPVEQNESETLRDMGLATSQQSTLGGKVLASALKPVATVASTALGAVGGKLATTPALKLSAQMGTKEQYDAMQDLRYDARRKVMDAMRTGQQSKAQDLLEQGIKDGIITKADIKAIKGQIKMPDILVQRVKRLKTADEAVQVFRVATPEEQDKIASIVYKKLKGSTQIRTATGEYTPQGNALIEEFKRVAKKGTILYKYLNE